MTYPSQNHQPSGCRIFNLRKTFGDKGNMKKGDHDYWKKRVQMASDFAVSKVFFQKKTRTAANSVIMPLQTSDQLRDHNETYSEAQAFINDWLSDKLRPELEKEEDDPIGSAATRSPFESDNEQQVAMNYTNFNDCYGNGGDLYGGLAVEDEDSAVRNFLQNLMEKEVIDCCKMEELMLDAGETRRKFRDPIMTMEARNLQVRENRARREAERQKQLKEREAERTSREQERRREQVGEKRRRQEARREEEMVQREIVRLRRQMKEKRCREQRLLQREKERERETETETEREKMKGQGAARSIESAPLSPSNQLQQDKERQFKEEKIQNKIHMHNLKCMQRHFSAWYLVLLDYRLHMGKARALNDWKTQLKVWRAWREVVLAEKKQREVERAEQELRDENRKCQLAVASDRKRLLQGCLNTWQRWCRMEGFQREFLAQQQETQNKMAALIDAASTGKLKCRDSQTNKLVTAPPEASDQPDTGRTARKKGPRRSGSSAPSASAVLLYKSPQETVAQPTQPWQVTRRHAAPTAVELQMAQQRDECGSINPAKWEASQGGRFKNRHAAQKQIITEQKKLLKEQQEEIARLKEQQSTIGLELEVQKTTQLTQLSILESSKPTANVDTAEQRGPQDTGKSPKGKADTQQNAIIMAMEARARQRAERRRELEELKRKKEEIKMAEFKAAEELKQREEEEMKRAEAMKKKEEKRLQREKEEEKQRELKRQKELLKLSHQHYHKNLLLRNGLAPWKRMLQLRQADIHLAESHHNLFVLRRCTLSWQQSARESLFEKKAYADQLYQRFLLRRGLRCWKELMDWQMVLEERAEYFYRIRTQRRFLSVLLDHVTQEKLTEWKQLDIAQDHNNRRVLWRSFQAWKTLPCMQRVERARERRREKLERIVAVLIPDFYPCTPTDQK